MQKKLIALAVAAAFSAPAFADVSLYGVADATLVRASGDGQKSDMQAVSGGLSQSRFGVKAVEDLDNGMKAVVVLEYGMDTEVNATIGTTGAGVLNARQQMLAVAGGFGTFATGYLQTTGYDFASKFDPTAGSAVSPLEVVNSGYLIGSSALAARAQRALAYISPDMGGVTVAVNYSTALALGATLGDLGQASAAASPKITATLLSATYNGGPLSVGAVYAATDNFTATLDVVDMALGASYDLGMVKLFGTYQTSKLDGATGTAGNTNKAMSFSAVAPVGPGAVAFTYAKNSIDSTTADDNGSGYTVAWLQGLSKTTTLYVALEKISQGSASRAYSVLDNALANANLTLGGSSQVLALGLNKKF
jgi:predicted porin